VQVHNRGQYGMVSHLMDVLVEKVDELDETVQRLIHQAMDSAGEIEKTRSIAGGHQYHPA
jgi:hypothetical protein